MDKPEPKFENYMGVTIGICDRWCPHFSYTDDAKIVQSCALKKGKVGSPTNSYLFSRICEPWAVEELKRLRELAGESVNIGT